MITKGHANQNSELDIAQALRDAAPPVEAVRGGLHSRIMTPISEPTTMRRATPGFGQFKLAWTAAAAAIAITAMGVFRVGQTRQLEPRRAALASIPAVSFSAAVDLTDSAESALGSEWERLRRDVGAASAVVAKALPRSLTRQLL